MPRCLAALAGLSLWLSLPLAAQTLVIRPGPEVLAGEPLQLSVVGAAPGARLSLRASRVMSQPWGTQQLQAQALFVADAQGRIDVDRQAPLDGSYPGADPRGLFWSMRRQPAGATPLPATPPGEVLLQLLDGEREIASQRLRLLPHSAEVVVSQPAEFPGATWARPGGTAPRPVLIVLGGSEGGSATARRLAPLLASHGYAVLGLPYYSPPGWGPQGPTPAELPALPSSFVDIELARLAQVRDWLARQPGMDVRRIGVYGVSKGAEFALAAASRMPWIKAVAAIVPSDVIWEGWGEAAPQPDRRSSFAWQGEPLAWVPYQDLAQELGRAARGQPIVLRRAMDGGRAAHPERVAAARIPVENIAGPVLLVAGGDDQVWDSAGMARAMAARREAAGRPTTLLVYPEAGHGLVDHGWNPTTTYQDSPLALGGTPAADARAQAQAWPQLLAFLKASL